MNEQDPWATVLELAITELEHREADVDALPPMMQAIYEASDIDERDRLSVLVAAEAAEAAARAWLAARDHAQSLHRRDDQEQWLDATDAEMDRYRDLLTALAANTWDTCVSFPESPTPIVVLPEWRVSRNCFVVPDLPELEGDLLSDDPNERTQRP